MTGTKDSVSLPQFLVDMCKRGDAILFTGAGFSFGASNAKGPLLGTRELTRQLLIQCSEIEATAYQDPAIALPYDLQLATELYSHRKGQKALLTLFEQYFRNCTPAPWHLQILALPWFRIYTVNIDDVIEHAFAKVSNGRRLLPRNGLSPAANITDGPLEVSYIKLHGSADGQSQVVFSKEDYARISANPNYWMTEFAGDYMEKVLIFIGASLSDSDFWHYIYQRVQLEQRATHERPECYAVTPDGRVGFSEILGRHKIVHIRMTGEEFTNALRRQMGTIPSAETIIKQRVAIAITSHDTDSTGLSSEEKLLLLKQLKSVRDEIKTIDRTKVKKSKFFLGNEPEWADIVHGRDAVRDLEKKILDDISSGRHQLIVGAPGEGKTTLLMRIAKLLTEQGQICYWFDDAASPNVDILYHFLQSIKEARTYLFIDRFSTFDNSWIEFLEKIKKEPITTELVMIATDRSTKLRGYYVRFESHNVKLHRITRLSRAEIQRVIKSLANDGMLGVLQNLSQDEKIAAFEERADKWLLVALREATRGKGFDQILQDEFSDLKSTAAIIPFLCIAVTHMHSLPLPARVLSSCMEALRINFDEHVKGLLQDAIEVDSRWYYRTRHPVIAEKFVNSYSRKSDLVKVIISLINILVASTLAGRRGRKSNEASIYRVLVRLDILSHLFGRNYRLIEEIYEGVKDACATESHYWLQYGSLAIKMRDFERAENYLHQSLQIQPAFEFTEHQLALLYLLRADGTADASEARGYYEEAIEHMKHVFTGVFTDPAYPYTTLFDLSARLLSKWKYKSRQIIHLKQLERYVNQAWNNPLLRKDLGLQKHLANLTKLLHRYAQPRKS